MKKIMTVVVALIILTVPFILVYQLTKADINISDFTHPIGNGFEGDVIDPFRDICFLGESQCIYHFGATELREDDTYWWILGENVWCVKSQMSFTEPVTNPNVEITQDSEVSCVDIAMFDKDDWNMGVGANGDGFYSFDLKGT